MNKMHAPKPAHSVSLMILGRAHLKKYINFQRRLTVFSCYKDQDVRGRAKLEYASLHLVGTITWSGLA